MRQLLLIALLASATPALADVPGYRLSLGADVRGGTLEIAPTITAPPGTRLRYEVETIKSGRSGNSNSSQAGSVTVGEDGSASLSQMALSLGAQDRAEVSVKVYDGARLVASKRYKHPQ